ncbi:MAG TPA: alpha/beta hydrolase [Usitatibacter sp.]|nr:alpha/beta hydrolase [Usitatibacter sp.]
MKSFPRIGLRVLLVLVALAILAAGAALSYRAWRQHLVAEATAIRGPDGIDEGMYVKIGGIDQWVQIRGWSRANPVILCLHGGPGGTWLALTPLFAAWEKHFTVVMWDQRGAGKTLETTGPRIASTMSVERMAQDGIEVAEFLRGHLHKEKVVLLGHSWGSILGVNMVRKRPDLFSAYVGTGQVVDMPRGISVAYTQLLNEARASHDGRSVAELTAIGAPPFANMEQVRRFFGVVDWYESDGRALAFMRDMVLYSPGLSLYDLHERQLGFTRVPTWSVYNEMLSADLRSVNDFQVPVYFIQGANDDLTPASLVQEYFARIQAPHKELVLLPGVGHFAVWVANDRFLRELLRMVSG